MKKSWFVIPLLMLPLSVVAQTPEEKGLAITVEADQRNTGWVDEISNIRMTLRNAHGQESVREIRNRILEVEGDGDKSMIIFDNPHDVQGTAFLTYSHALKADEQWMFLPALKRVKRISSANKSGPFMGSEFAYEDIASDEVEKYTYKFLRDEATGGRDAYVIERYPQYKHSGYKRQIVWMDQEIYRPLKIEFYDRKDALLKTLVYRGYNQYLEQYWRVDQMEMVNHQTGKSTVLVWSDYQYNNGFIDRDFDQRSLERVR